MKSNFFIHAVNVHQGGGQVLLSAIIRALPNNIPVTLIVDERMPLPDNITPNIFIKQVYPSYFRRYLVERWLKGKVKAGDVVLCFGNLPPLYKLNGRVILFLQNRHLVDDAVSFRWMKNQVKVRIWLERIWFFKRFTNVDEVLVQTPSMKKLLHKRMTIDRPINVRPFFGNKIYISRSILLKNIKINSEFDFLYVASGEPHKNHRKLINAWTILAKDGIYPSLKLTIDKALFPELSDWINQVKNVNQLNIDNIGSTSADGVGALYQKASALIFPSTCESLGLPLIEARQAGLSILASELDYVRDILDPEQTFDARSSRSIARAVKRFLKVGEPELTLSDAKTFLNKIICK